MGKSKQGLGPLKLWEHAKQIQRKHIIYGALMLVILLVSSASLLRLSPYRPNGAPVQYYRATVLSVQAVGSSFGQTENIRARLMDGHDKGQAVSVTRNVSFGDTSYKRLPLGSQILLTKDSANGNQYQYGDRWHIPGLAALFLILLVLVVLVGWWRGITSVFGLAISIGVLSVYVIPRILDGHSAYAVCLEGAFIITIISVYVAHGFSRRTTIAFVSSLITLLAIIGLVALTTYLVGTSEIIDDTTAGVLYGSHSISLSGLLTGGIIIASLGVLYDITTGQAAAVDEIYKANRKQSALQLYRKALSVGREHIAALVNTLALVYVGVALPTIVLTALYVHAPLVVVFNNEAIVEEVVRTAVASIGMLLAVPITTGLAAYILPKWYGPTGRRFMKRLKLIINF